MSLLSEIWSTIFDKGLESFGRFYSSYRGFVLSVDDKKNKNRILLSVPHVLGQNSKGVWAYPKNQLSTILDDDPETCSITQFMPQVGDMVWVEFEAGDPRYAIWSHAYNLKNKPKEFKDLKVFGMKTPAGHVVSIDDTQGIITVTHKETHTLIIDKDLITIKHRDGKNIIIDKDKIQLNGGTLKGIAKIDQLITELNKRSNRENDIVLALQTLQAACSPITAPLVGSALAGLIGTSIINITTPVTPASLSTLEDTKVTH
jgi:hypothetical protein